MVVISGNKEDANRNGRFRELAPLTWKGLALGLSASLLPNLFPSHRTVAFGIGLIGGMMAFHFLPPRGRHFWFMLAVGAAAFVIWALCENL
jgi:hypothetical protein